ncbi:uncharacterized protein LOC126902195 isoform X3 [Daktulosphaira vitifoliae]|uniref:uncharacterized protein LOC126902195 isoform X3 n=1 Tax=Daktulosphaira vitifoliae TaxID=58002 RepID=UPI0021AA2D29|nr:uncharacterized protein LOC126902195 isoform X3 [Daktulosphaira vitifoliae]
MVHACYLCSAIVADGVSLHKFPSDVERAQRWLAFVATCGYDPAAVNLRSAFICSRHFDPVNDYRTNPIRRLLISTAVPTVIVANPEAARPSQSDVEIVGIAVGDDEAAVGDINDMVEVVEAEASPEIVDVVPFEVQVVGAPVEPSPEFVDVGLDDLAAVVGVQNEPALDVAPSEDDRRGANPEREQAGGVVEAVPVQPVELIAHVRDVLPEENCIGRMNYVCAHCNARHFGVERLSISNDARSYFSLCCSNGLVALADDQVLLPVPDLLKDLMLGDSAQSRSFRAEIRPYNSALAFASFIVNNPPADRAPEAQPGRRLPGGVFTAHGQMYHRMSRAAIPNRRGATPRYCQLYFISSTEATAARIEANRSRANLLDSVLRQLDEMLRAINPYAEAFRNMNEVWVDKTRRPPEEAPQRVTMFFIEDRNSDPRRYNASRVNEVAAVFTGENGLPPAQVDFAVYDRATAGPAMRTLSTRSPHIDPMVYPLLFPNGERGWNPHMEQTGARRTTNRQRVSIREFMCYRLAVRYGGNNDGGGHGGFSPLHAGGFLFQQLLCDYYVRMESERFEYYEAHQSDFFVEAYQGLMDHINGQHDVTRDNDVGSRVILPASHTAGVRFMKRRYHDAMALVRTYGKPDLFITFTCNPKWTEIADNLSDALTYIDRSDLVTRVFHAKLKALMDDLTRRNVFGRVAAYVYTVEFQKRGLPHAHILLILDERFKIRSAEDVDRIVRADIPDPVAQPTLHRLVKTHMLHGPCGVFFRTSPCWDQEKNVCTKQYPKPYCEETVYRADGGYPEYRRPDNGRTVEVRRATLDSQWVVPYNPYLTAKYNAHINVEVCSSVKSVMYLYKYVYKGHDAATFAVLNNNEIQSYLNTRYVSPPEAFWRLAKYEIQKQSHAVVKLPVHLEGREPVYFRRGELPPAVLFGAGVRTMLTEFFQLNRNDAGARRYLYHEIPNSYVWDGREKSWRVRQRAQTYPNIARMYAVSPCDRERFYLRTLLLYRRGPIGFEDLRTVDGTVYPTYAEAATALGILRDDRAWRACMREASVHDTPHQLRCLFVTILLHCSPNDPPRLYDEFKDNLMEDYFRRRADRDTSEAMCLAAVERHLAASNRTLAGFGLPEPDRALLVPDAAPADNATAAADVAELVGRLNEQQRTIYDRVMRAVGDTRRRLPKLFYVSGAGGCGKTFLYNCLISAIRSRGGTVISVAYTGIAASLIQGGQTVHSTFGVRVAPHDQEDPSYLAMQSRKAQALRAASLIVWDEASMSPTSQLRVADRLLRDVMNVPDTPFGGKPVLFAGDFRQTLPIVKRGSRAQIVSATIRHGVYWVSMEKYSLERNMRADGDRPFADWLLQLGAGSLNNGLEYVTIPAGAVSESFASLLDFVYPRAMSLDNVRDYAKHIVLCVTNDECKNINDQVLRSRVTGSQRVYTATDTVVADDDDEAANFPVEFLNTLEADNLPPYRLTLKVGAIVMLLKNLDTTRRLCNGTRLNLNELTQITRRTLVTQRTFRQNNINVCAIDMKFIAIIIHGNSTLH